jgi:predicted PurR-regulated permease PerM
MEHIARNPQSDPQENDLYKTLAKVVFLAAGVCVALWFLDITIPVLLLFAFAAMLSIALNAPTTWLERRGLHRVLAALLVTLAVAVVLAAVGWLVVPRVIAQVTDLMTHLPEYLNRLTRTFGRLLRNYPAVSRWLHLNPHAPPNLSPLVNGMLLHVGSYTMTAFEFLVSLLVLAGTVIYTIANPRPLLHGYLTLMPPHLRAPAQRAFTRAAQMVTGWIWSHVIVGTMEAVVSGIFLSLLGVPGALVWAAFTFFAELVPRIGAYLMALPPLLAALSVSPMTALWVALCYTTMNEINGNITLPLLWGENMDLHPVSLLFMVMALWTAFGFLGALISVPLTGFLKAYYEEFYLARQPISPRLDRRVERMLDRQLEPEEAEPEPAVADWYHMQRRGRAKTRT